GTAQVCADAPTSALRISFKFGDEVFEFAMKELDLPRQSLHQDPTLYNRRPVLIDWHSLIGNPACVHVVSRSFHFLTSVSSRKEIHRLRRTLTRLRFEMISP